VKELYVSGHVEVKRRIVAFSRAVTYSWAMVKRKNPAAVALGKKGGKKGGPARAANMTPEERSESARNAVVARWARYYERKGVTKPKK
jgi:hypothetical protein